MGQLLSCPVDLVTLGNFMPRAKKSQREGKEEEKKSREFYRG
jgi:hypothetical protein